MAQFSKKSIGIALLSVALVAGGTGLWWAKKHKTVMPVSGDAVLANPDAPFTMGSCLARLHDDKPALAVMFSQSVDADQALDKLIEVSDLGDSKADKNKVKSGDASATAASISPDIPIERVSSAKPCACKLCIA